MKNIQCVVMSAAALALVGAGCVTYKDQAKTMTSATRTGQFAAAAKQFDAKARKKENTKDAVIWHLEAGAAYRAAGDFTNSLRHLNAAAARIGKYEEQAKVKVGREAGAIMSNQQNLPYEGKSYDKIMLHTYAALDCLALGDLEKARPEIIHAYHCQQDAVDENARRIEKAREDEEKSSDKEKIQKSKSDPKFSAAIEGATKNLEGFKFYADYVNPFTVYLDGLYFLYAGSGGSDLEHANKSLNRVIEVCGDNKFVAEDLQTVTNAFAGQTPPPCTYVIFETGQAASLDQIRIDVPIIVTKVSYVGAAFPKLVFHDDHAPCLSIKAGDSEETTLPLANMDSVIALDFKNEFPIIVTKTLISVVAKTATSYAINDAAARQDNLAGAFTKLFTAAYIAFVNIADTRSWTSLPKEFQIARMSTPADHKITLTCSGCAPVEVNLLDGPINVVCAKSTSTAAPLIVSQFTFGTPSLVQLSANENK